MSTCLLVVSVDGDNERRSYPSLRQTEMTPSRSGDSQPIKDAIRQFGRMAAAKLGPGEGEEEAQIRGPVERLVHDIGAAFGLQAQLYDEARLPEISVRPDFAVHVDGVCVGYLELKRPGHGVPDTWRRSSPHSRRQWERLALLPNVLYTDGEQWALYRSGRLDAPITRLSPKLRSAGLRLAESEGDLGAVISAFLTWKPLRPRSVSQLVRTVARLCRLLREEIIDAIAEERLAGDRKISRLVRDWRELLFPRLNDNEFADAYAQTVTFALLLARQEVVDFAESDIVKISQLLGKRHLLLGKALNILTEEYVSGDYGVAVDVLVRVISTVEWSEFPEDAHVHLYEQFLEQYDPAVRRLTGSYYTPSRLVEFMTEFVDQVLRDVMGKERGFADNKVFTLDPAMGTGSFLEQVVEKVAQTTTDVIGPGAVPEQLWSLAHRMAGFEKQAAPYAVAQLRLQGALRQRGAEVPNSEFLFLTDTLDDPGIPQIDLGSFYSAIKDSWDGATRVKRDVPVMVVLGNPPYLERAKRNAPAPWVERRGDDKITRPNLDAFRVPGAGRLEYKLANLYIYFWRFATWKVFDAHQEQPDGVVAFVTASSYATGQAFAGMREYFRRTADQGWIIDLSPEGYQPPVRTRLFPPNQQPLCIGIFVRRGEPQPDKPAAMRYFAVHGDRAQKFEQLSNLDLMKTEWRPCQAGWRDPFVPQLGTAWDTMPALSELMPWVSPGVKPNRTWVYAPDAKVLRERWSRLIRSCDEEKRALLIETDDVHIDCIRPDLLDANLRRRPLREETDPCLPPVRVAYRSFDRQYIIPDNRVIDRSRRSLWSVASPHQIFVSEQHTYPVRHGPALTFAADVPDMHHFHGHHGGRAYPVYRDSDGRTPNVAPTLLDYLSRQLSLTVHIEDLVAYIAAIVAHLHYTERFTEELSVPGGVRIPLTADAMLWRDGVELGRRVIWIHTFGERYADIDRGRPFGLARLSTSKSPRVLTPIVNSVNERPSEITYDEQVEKLCVDSGRIAPVSAAVWNYQVADMHVVRHWFSYRCESSIHRNRSGLESIRAPWSAQTTESLLELLNLVGLLVDLEPLQADLLARVLDGRMISKKDLFEAGVLPVPGAAKRAPSVRDSNGLW